MLQPERRSVADSQKSMVSVVAIIAIVILVGIVIYFVMQERNDSTIEIDLGSGTPIPTLMAGWHA